MYDIGSELENNLNPTRADIDNFLVDMKLAGKSPVGITLTEESFKNLIRNILEESALEDEHLNYQEQERENIIKRSVAMRVITFHGVTGNLLIGIKERQDT